MFVVRNSKRYIIHNNDLLCFELQSEVRKKVETQNRDLQRDQALNKHELKEHSRKLEFETNAKKQFEKKLQELQSKLDSDSDMREESTKLQRKVQSLEKEVPLNHC